MALVAGTPDRLDVFARGKDDTLWTISRTSDAWGDWTSLGGKLWVVKAQVHAGGRGKAGGVKLARDVSAVRAAAKTHTPVIVITADHSAEVQRGVRTRGYFMLRKPLKAAALRALMYQLTRQRAVAAE